MSKDLVEIKKRYERVLSNIQNLSPKKKAGHTRLIAVPKSRPQKK